jgi:hypothetical protein
VTEKSWQENCSRKTVSEKVPLLHIEKFAMTTCDESTLSSQNSREKVQFFNFVLNPARIRRSLDGIKLSSVLRRSSR